ncbi:MAG TPA: glycine--tRNA ligase subunit beta, partial [Candidatus Saccharimonadia bacterium]|nr:glycine--tRNA ligase subunit beta [Candidatus Saccharimonadia bacterium]
MSAPPLLVEIGTEELPPKALPGLAAAFRDGIVAGLAKRGIAHESARALWSPRRLAVLVEALATQQPDQAQERRGPAVAAAFDEHGKPSRALEGFAASCNVAVDALEKLETDKGAWYVHRAVKPGEATSTLLPAIVSEALTALPVPKPMRWGDRDIAFVRPAHWFVLLHGDAIVDAEVLGLKSDRLSRGHRFHHPKPVWIAHPRDYVEALRAAHVVVDPDERRARIRAQVEAIAAKAGGSARISDALLEEVSNLTEWPVAISCAFEQSFLRVPQEALVTTMESNQKFFPIVDGDGALTERFVGVANIDSRDPDEIRRGYERVIRPRFADAAFFYDEDLKSPLAHQQKALERVTYQQKLGTLWDKTCRVAELARQVANRVHVDGALATHAAALSRCDLMTRMVGEFPELQGTMGRYYATAQGEEPEVARALDEFYAPRFAGDAIAEGGIARVLAVADKADTLAGAFAIGQKPTGNKDPFSLRRTALGLARTLIEGGLEIHLIGLFREALDALSPAAWVASKPSGTAEVGSKVIQATELVANELYDFV